ncbi:aromatic amino acid transport family protein [uncultured Clostridium sp.]|uniref:aromatic amino acid transport family protein n=1 Tax=uncultured Clostridium sp. TaxID=59620 RepID=UPI00338E47BF
MLGIFKFDSDMKHRLLIVLIVYAIPLVLVLGGFVGFVDSIYFSGTFCAALMAILPAGW